MARAWTTACRATSTLWAPVIMGGDIAAWAALRGYKVTLQDRETKYIAPAIGPGG